MGNYTYNNMNSLTSEYEVSEVLEHFNSQYIFDIIQEKINTRFTPTMSAYTYNPNIVLSFEDNFNRCKAVFPEDLVNINNVRDETYREIIDIITKNYNITFKYMEGIDIYTYAYYIYDFFVCNFTNFIASFFAEYIFANKDNLYNALNLDAYKKQKDGTTAYGKKIYDDNKLVIIANNIVMVVNSLQSFDITNRDIFSIIYGTKNIVDMLDACLLVPYDLFKLFFSIPADYQPILFTNIRLNLQSLALKSLDKQDSAL